LLEAAVKNATLRRILNVSSFAVYSNMNIKRGGLLDESCEIESKFMERFEAYCYAKVKQDEMIVEYAKKHNFPYAIVRPGAVYGPGVRQLLPPRVGNDSFGIFMNIGGSNRLPLTYLDNCAEAIVLAGIHPAAEGEVFNIVDDDLLTSRTFLKRYKQNVGNFRSLSIPFRIFYLMCYAWEKYSKWSKEQVPPVFNRRKCAALWKGNSYTNAKLKKLGWTPKVPLDHGLRNYFEYLKAHGRYKNA
jgi:nucleoside-diphosphate-sugar epimerase